MPDYQTLMLPLLELLKVGVPQDLSDITETLAKRFRLTDVDRAELLPSGKQRKFDNRVGWARTYLKKAGLLETPGVGRVKITARGLDVLKRNPPKIDRKFLMQFPGFVEFQKVQRKEPEPEYTKLDLAVDTRKQLSSQEGGCRLLQRRLSSETHRLRINSNPSRGCL